MVYCNLAVLMAERNLRITKISIETGISRTTLTSLATNRSQGIQFDTLDTLCRYLNVTLEQLIFFTPYVFEFNLKEMEPLSSDMLFEIEAIAYGTKKKYKAVFNGEVTLRDYNDENEATDVDVDVVLPYKADEETAFVYKLINEFPIPVQIGLGTKLSSLFFSTLVNNHNIEIASHSVSGLTWFNNPKYVPLEY